MPNREQAIQEAIEQFNSGVYTSLRAAAIAYSIPPSTLRGRIAGASNSHASHAYQQRLTPEQEAFLVRWILKQEAQGFPPSHARAREMAGHVLAAGGDYEPLGRR
jgi:hypothetical protein